MRRCVATSWNNVLVIACMRSRLFSNAHRVDSGLTMEGCSLNRGWRKADDAGIDVHAKVTMMVLSIFS